MIFSKQEIKEKQPIFDNFARGWFRLNNKLSLSRIPCTNEFSIPQKYYLSRPPYLLITSWNSQASFRLTSYTFRKMSSTLTDSRTTSNPEFSCRFLVLLPSCLCLFVCFPKAPQIRHNQYQTYGLNKRSWSLRNIRCFFPQWMKRLFS